MKHIWSTYIATKKYLKAMRVGDKIALLPEPRYWLEKYMRVKTKKLNFTFLCSIIDAEEDACFCLHVVLNSYNHSVCNEDKVLQIFYCCSSSPTVRKISHLQDLWPGPPPSPLDCTLTMKRISFTLKHYAQGPQ